jgi:hypothetical protein
MRSPDRSLRHDDRITISIRSWLDCVGHHRRRVARRPGSDGDVLPVNYRSIDCTRACHGVGRSRRVIERRLEVEEFRHGLPSISSGNTVLTLKPFERG